LEEVLHVIYCINRVLSVVAISALHSIQNNAKILNIDFDINDQNKTSQEQGHNDVQIFDESSSLHQPGVTMLNGSFMDVSTPTNPTNNDIKLNSMLIEDVHNLENMDNIEKMEIQEDSPEQAEQELKNKDKGIF